MQVRLKDLLNLILTAILGSKNTSIHQKNPQKTSENKKVEAKPVAIEISAYFSDPKSGNDRRLQYPDDYTNEILANAKITLEKVNSLLEELGMLSCQVSSGWRPPSVNKAIGGAKRSLHTQGKAIDIRDGDGSIAKTIEDRPDLLKKYDLWLEDPSFTKGWCHLDWGTRTDRPSRMFKP
jgi:hypothetical protein